LRLLEKLREKPTWLVVHSGPPEEVEQLVHLAREDMLPGDDGQIVAVVPQGTAHPEVSSYRFFPASLLHPHVHRLVTGAGYNCIAEACLCREKHLCHAFSRRYDEQNERLRELFLNPAPSTENGAPAAARWIASLL
jgi:hypothetical protein